MTLNKSEGKSFIKPPTESSLGEKMLIDLVENGYKSCSPKNF
jgi:hypothetical protein